MYGGTQSFVRDVCGCTVHDSRCERRSPFDVASPQPRAVDFDSGFVETPSVLKEVGKKKVKDFLFQSPPLFGGGPSVQTVSAGTLSRRMPWAPQLLAPASP